MTVSPTVLTAGVVSELTDPELPLTITITDTNGAPVDLTKSSNGDYIKHDDVWNMLFKDPHPDDVSYFGRDAKLPQYYWTRTDLHDDDSTEVCNETLFGKDMIDIDFSRAPEGIYIFKGFVANDAGEFYISAHTPDRKKAGSVRIRVKSPVVDYSIVNTADPEMKTFDSPGDPDFIMTALDNRIYNVTVTVRDAMGNIITGVTEGVSLCTGIKRTARFTPFTTRPANFEWVPDPVEVVVDNFYGTGGIYAIESIRDRYHLHIGLDLDNNGILEWDNRELHAFGPQVVYDINRNTWTNYLTYYNTTNYRYNDGEFSTHPFFDLPPALHGGWGLGAIYNSPKFGGMVMSDFNDDKKIDYRDSLNLDSSGRTSFYIFAEDACYVGGLVGNNYFGDMDVAGRPPTDERSPEYITSRYRGDWIYYLDFDAIPDNVAQIAPPQFQLLWAATREEIDKSLLDTELYDLVYAKENHIIALAAPADYRDLPIMTKGQVGLQGNQSETAIYGRLERNEQYDTTEANVYFTPTGVGAEVIELVYRAENTWYYNGLVGSPRDYYIEEVLFLDSIKGLEIEVTWSEQPAAGKIVEAEIFCHETGTKKPVPDVLVTLSGGGVEKSAITDSQGIAVISCEFAENATITITASKQGYLDDEVKHSISGDSTPPELTLDETPKLTRDDVLIVQGTTEPGAVVAANGTSAVVDGNGNFMVKIKLETGVNEIKVVAKDKAGNETLKVITIELDDIPPNILLDDMEKLIDVDFATIKGSVEPGSRVRVGQVEATVINDYFQAELPMKKGINKIHVVAMDKAGNSTEMDFELIVWHKTTISMQIGNNVVIVDEQLTPPLEAPPYIKNSRTMVPIRAISQGFGATVEWIPEDRSVVVTLDDGLGETYILMRIGSDIAIVNNETVKLDAAPEIVAGRTFVPLRFVAENLGCTVEYEAETKIINMERVSY